MAEMRRGRTAVAMSMLAGWVGLAAVAASLAGCATVTRWLEGRQAKAAPWKTVNAAVAYEIVRDTPDVFILDLRTPEEFQGPRGHLRNAFCIPLSRLPYRLLEIRAYGGETFLVYCDADDCGRAGMKILKDSGFQFAILIGGGIEGWIRAGFPTFVRAGTLPAPTATVKPEKHPELVPGAAKPKGELPVVPPPPPPEPPPPGTTR